MLELKVTLTVPNPYAQLLELEASSSGRTVEQHVRHILGRRCDNLIRICTCGYFLYASTDDLRCQKCGKPCCPYCSSPQDEADVCFGCRPGGKGGFRAAPEGKV